MTYPVKHSHEERINLSQEILERLKNKYKENLLAVAFFGSMSRDEDTDYSDVDMSAIIKGENIAEEMMGIVNGLKYGVDIFSQDVVHSKITSVHMRWPLLVGKFVTALPIYDEQGLFTSYKQLFDETIKKDFRPFIKEIFIEEIYEDCNKSIAITSTGTRAQVIYNSFNLLTKMVSFLGVINKSYYSSSVTFAQKAMSFPINFPSFKEFGESVVSDKLMTNEELRVTVQNLLNEITDYLKSNDIIFEE